MMEYRYPRFRRELMKQDASFGSGPGPGGRFPDFELSTPDGERVSSRDLLGERPVLFTLGSFT